MPEQEPDRRERLEARVYVLNRTAQNKYKSAAKRLSEASRITLAIKCLDEVRLAANLSKQSEIGNHIIYQTDDGVIYCDLDPQGIEVSDTEFKGPGFRATRARRDGNSG